MITGIDHVVIGVHDLDAGLAAYERLLNRGIALRYERDGVATALIATANVAVELMAPVGDAPMAERLRSAIEEHGEGLLSMAVAVSDIERMHRRIERVGLAPDAISDGEAGALRWRRFRANTEAANGVRLFFIERETPLSDMSRSDVHALDHVVIHNTDMERAAALYGARLGLDMRLDRHVGDRRLMFFRCGDLVVEIAQASEPAHRLWGLSWRVSDAAATQARLASEGVNVTAVRDGFKPGTRVFSVRDNTCGVPTLMLQPSPNRD
jgi:catechol 2,3-dioxygenase-like lactoylglutathione lyase family enzyme